MCQNRNRGLSRRAFVATTVAIGGSSALSVCPETEGAEIVVDTPAGQQTRFQHSRSDFVSLGAREVHAGLGDREATTGRLTWPDGTSGPSGTSRPVSTSP